ncbi:MAG: DUF58 domain-containing protein, partial [Terriglobales bacterium]
VMISAMAFVTFLSGLFMYGVAAFIGNEWFYLLAAAFMIAPVISFIYPLIMLLDIKASVSLPKEAVVTDMAAISLTLSRRSQALMLSWAFPVRCFAVRMNVLRRSVDSKTEQKVVSDQPIFIDELTGSSRLDFKTSVLRRGIYYLKEVEIFSAFPLDFICWRRKISMPRNAVTGELPIVTVYPKVFTVAGNFLSALPGIPAVIGVSTSASVTTYQSTYYRSVREWRTGDSLRHVHWASSARTNKLLVREFDQEVLPVFDLLLNLRANWRNPEQFELAVSTLSSLCDCGYRQGKVPELQIDPPVNCEAMAKLMADIPPEAAGFDRVLEILARVEPVPPSREDGAKTNDDEEEEGSKYIPLLAVLPCDDEVLKFFPGRGDVVCSPVEIAMVSRQWKEVEEPVELSKGFALDKMIANLRPQPRPGSRKPVVPQATEIIGRADWEGDIETL